MDLDEIGEYLEHHGLSDDEIDTFLEHYGVKGQKWGVRKNRKIEERRAKGMGVNQLRNENKRVAEAGGGLKGTIRVRREMVKNGELTPEQARAGTIALGERVALGMLAGALIGVGIGKLTTTALNL